MRMTAIATAAAMAALLTGAASAANSYYFAKPGVQYAEFRHDQVMCERASYTARYGRNVGYNSRPIVYAGHSTPSFFRCMYAKGYREDPNGFRTGRLWFFASR